MTEKKTTAIDPELLEILACPENHQGLAEADAALLEQVNAKIASGSVKNVAGKAVTEKLEAGLVRADKGRIYPIKEGIPVLLIDEGIDL